MSEFKTLPDKSTGSEEIYMNEKHKTLVMSKVLSIIIIIIIIKNDKFILPQAKLQGQYAHSQLPDT